MYKHRFLLLAGTLGFACGRGVLSASPISVPNYSFESPATVFVNTHIDSWQKAAKPEWYNESSGYLWDQLAGVFKNTAVTSSDHIDNCDANQAAYMFAVPEVSLSQDYDSTDWSHPSPSHDFNATFDVGRSYLLTVGLIGGGGGMLPGASLELSLYYRDAGSNVVKIVTNSVTNNLQNFPTTTHLVDFQVHVPVVQPADAWAGQHIGIQILSTVDTNLEGGYWDLDNVRLSSTAEPVWVAPVWTNGHFAATLQSEPGTAFEILATTNAALPNSDWTSLGTVTNLTGSFPFVDPAAGSDRRFYRARRQL